MYLNRIYFDSKVVPIWALRSQSIYYLGIYMDPQGTLQHSVQVEIPGQQSSPCAKTATKNPLHQKAPAPGMVQGL